MSGKKKLLITGGLGNLGSWLSYFFSEKFDVYILSRNTSNTLSCKYTLIECDITNLEGLRKKLNITFDFCIHTASYNEFFHDDYSKKALMINTLGTRNLLEVLKDSKIKSFIYLSTFHVYGENSGVVSEKTSLCPRNDYASTHLFAEYYLKQFCLTEKFPFVIFRLTNSYGAPKYLNSTKWYLVLNDLVKSAYEEGVITLNSNGLSRRDFIWMEDVCHVIAEAFYFKKSIDNIFNLSSGKSFSVMDLAEKVQKSYLRRYNKKIDIIINREDKSINNLLHVSNTKLLNVIHYKFHDKVEDEIENIFNLLEIG